MGILKRVSVDLFKRVSVELLRRESNYSDKKMYFCADFFDMMVEVKNKTDGVRLHSVNIGSNLLGYQLRVDERAAQP